MNAEHRQVVEALEARGLSVREWVERDVYLDQRRAVTAGEPVVDLTEPDALAQGIRLRDEDGLSYNAIAAVLRRYHGVDWTPRTVQYRLRHYGGVAAKPHRREVAS